MKSSWASSACGVQCSTGRLVRLVLILLNVYCALGCSKLYEEFGYKLTIEFGTIFFLLVCGIAEAYEP